MGKAGVSDKREDAAGVKDAEAGSIGNDQDCGPVEDCAECQGHEESKEHDEDGEMMLDEHNKGRVRPRKRKLYGDICKQLEFYFSDANITKNRMMQEMVMGQEYVELKTFLEFNRIKALSLKLEDLQKSVVTSDKLELSPDSIGVKRKVPYDPKKLKSDTEVEECTIYVESVPKHADHAFLETIFQNFGPISYISLPKFRSSKLPKGFAFIEFDTPETANRCLEAYKGEGGCLPTDMDPATLMSIQTYSAEQELLQKEDFGVSPPGSSPRKRKVDEVEKNSSSLSKKPKLSSNPTPPAFAAPSESNDVLESNTETSEMREKKKRKRKKNKATKSAEEKLEGDAIHLKVMPKKTWRQLRNRYLNLQRQNMSKLKKQLRDQQLREQYYRNCIPKEEKEDPEMNANSNIIEITLDSPAESVDAFKKQIKVDLSGESEEEAAISGFIKYIDYEEGGLRAFIRFNEDPDFITRIENYLSNAEKVFQKARFLTVRESLEYKQRVQEALKQKRKEQPKKNIRGKDRLLKAASRSSHIRFDGNENDQHQNGAVPVDGEEMEVDGRRNGQITAEGEPVSTTV